MYAVCRPVECEGFAVVVGMEAVEGRGNSVVVVVGVDMAVAAV